MQGGIEPLSRPAALRRLQDSYELLQAGKPAKHADAILAEVEAALKTVEKGNM
jgi:hypothetical protein